MAASLATSACTTQPGSSRPRTSGHSAHGEIAPVRLGHADMALVLYALVCRLTQPPEVVGELDAVRHPAWQASQLTRIANGQAGDIVQADQDADAHGQRLVADAAQARCAGANAHDQMAIIHGARLLCSAVQEVAWVVVRVGRHEMPFGRGIKKPATLRQLANLSLGSEEEDSLNLVLVSPALVALQLNQIPAQLPPDLFSGRWRLVLCLATFHVIADLFLCGLHCLHHLPPP
jgi:hypothetical protein